MVVGCMKTTDIFVDWYVDILRANASRKRNLAHGSHAQQQRRKYRTGNLGNQVSDSSSIPTLFTILSHIIT